MSSRKRTQPNRPRPNRPRPSQRQPSNVAIQQHHRLSALPAYIPRNPATVYRGTGWNGWADQYGILEASTIDLSNIRTVLQAVRPTVGGWTHEVVDLVMQAVPPNIEDMDGTSRLGVMRTLLHALDFFRGDTEMWWERNLILNAIDLLNQGQSVQFTDYAELIYQDAIAARLKEAE